MGAACDSIGSYTLLIILHANRKAKGSATHQLKHFAIQAGEIWLPTSARHGVEPRALRAVL